MDSALHLGTRHTEGLKALSKMLAHHGDWWKPCPLCDENNLDPNPIGYLLRVHQHEIGLDRTPVDSVDQLVTQIADCNIYFLYKFRKLFLQFGVFYIVHCCAPCRALSMNLEPWQCTEKLLKDGGVRVSKRHLKEIIFKIGRESLLATCAVVDKAPLVATIAQEVGWEVVWDAALSGGG